jgi:hypothetical protein
VRADTELLTVFPPDGDDGARLALRIRGGAVSSMRPSERVLASAVRYAMYPLHCSLAADASHVPPTVRPPCHTRIALLVSKRGAGSRSAPALLQQSRSHGRQLPNSLLAP